MDVPMAVWVYAASFVLGVLLFVWSVGARDDSRARAVRSNLAEATGSATDVRQVQLSRSAQERITGPLFEVLGRVGTRVTPRGISDAIERRVALAGLGSTWPVERVLAVKLILVVTGFALGLLGFAGNPTPRGALAAIALPIGGFIVPDVLLGQRASKRQQDILKKLPDGLDEITIAVEAGLGFEAAMAQAGRSMPGPLADEFRRTLHDVQIGVPRGEALANFVKRTDVPDIRHFVIAVRQAEQYGVPIAQVLRVQSKEMRERRRQRAEERAMKMPVKILVPTVFFILPSLFIVILGPAALRLVDSLGG